MQIALLKIFTSPHFEQRSRILLVRFFILSLLFIWVVGFLVPLISNFNNPLSNFILSRLYSTICHQQHLKCISIGNDFIFVCARCTGVYFGALISGITSLLIIGPYISNRLLLYSLSPLLVDVFLTSAGVYSYSKAIAFITGLISGGVVYFFIIVELEKYILKQITDSGNE